MTIEEALRTYLASKSAITSVVSTKIFPIVPEGAALPWIVYEKTSGSHEKSLAGGSGVAQATIAVNCYAATYAGAKSLAAAAWNALDAFRGTMGTVAVRSCDAESLDDQYVPPIEAAEIGAHMEGMSLRLWYVQAAPTG